MTVNWWNRKETAAVLRSENWPVSNDILISKYSKCFKKFTDSTTFDKLYSTKQHAEKSPTCAYSK
jgi:hypothetical protein